MNKEIAIIHLALNMPQRIIHLGDWEFVCFVNHTQMVEQKLFEEDKETNCDIMFLVRRTTETGEDKIRLMSYKSNPWLAYDEDVDMNDKEIYKQAIFIFNGNLSFVPTEDSEGNLMKMTKEDKKKISRRFNNDKIQTAELITKTNGSYEQYMLIIQFNDCIV